jgi:hypothetical protein
MIPPFPMPQTQTQMPAPIPGSPGGSSPLFVSPQLGGWLAGIAAGALTYWAVGKVPGKKLVPGVRIGASIVVGFIVKQGVKRKLAHLETQKHATYLTTQQFGGVQIPQGTYTLPPGLPGASGTITTAAFDPEMKAGEIVNAYNPEGYTSDEDAMLKAILEVHPKSFSVVAQAYTQLYGRNLLADLDEQLNGFPYQQPWQAYRKQIQ